VSVEDDSETGVEGASDPDIFRERRRVAGGEGNGIDVEDAEGEVRLDVRRLLQSTNELALSYANG
jgi:hypothetical protein